MVPTCPRHCRQAVIPPRDPVEFWIHRPYISGSEDRRHDLSALPGAGGAIWHSGAQSARIGHPYHSRAHDSKRFMNSEDIIQNKYLTACAGSLEHYIHSVSGIPVLTAAEEQALADRLVQHGDIDAARRLVLAHLRFVVYIARGYSGYGLAQSDLIQEGNLGLMKAVKRFDPSRGVRLVSFAVHWIRAEIHEFILQNWRIVKVATTKAQRKLFFKLRSSKKRFGWMNQQEVGVIADALGVKPREVMEMEKRLGAVDASFDGPAEHAAESGGGSGVHQASRHPVAYLSDPQADPGRSLELAEGAEHMRKVLGKAIASLDERSRDIVRRRWCREEGKSTLKELAEHYQVSAERIRQIEAVAMKTLRAALDPA